MLVRLFMHLVNPLRKQAKDETESLFYSHDAWTASRYRAEGGDTSIDASAAQVINQLLSLNLSKEEFLKQLHESGNQVATQLAINLGYIPMS